MNGDFFFEDLRHASFYAFQIEQWLGPVNSFAITFGNVRGIFDALHRIAHVFGGGQPAIFLLAEKTGQRWIEDGVFGFDLADFIFQGLLAAFLTHFRDPAMDALHHRILRRPLKQSIGLDLGLFPALLAGQLHDLFYFRIISWIKLNLWRRAAG